MGPGSGDRPPRIFVVAGTFDQFDYWFRFIYCALAQPHKVKARYASGAFEADGIEVLYIRDSQRLQGQRIEEAQGDRVVLYGTYQERKDWPEVAARLRMVWS